MSPTRPDRFAGAAAGAEWVRAALAMGLFAEFVYVVHVVLSADGQKGEGPIANILLGALVAALGSVLSYYFGSSPREHAQPAGTARDPIATEVVNPPASPVPVSAEPAPGGPTADAAAGDVAFSPADEDARLGVLQEQRRL